MLINVFDGGWNQRKAPQMLQLNEGVEYTNIDPEPGTLKPVRANASANPPGASGGFHWWFEAKQQFVATDQYRQAAELNNVLYQLSSTGLTVHTTTTSRAGGVQQPTAAPAGSIISAPVRVSRVPTRAEASAVSTALPPVTQSYLVVNENAAGNSAAIAVSVAPLSGRPTIRDPNLVWRDAERLLEPYEIFADLEPVGIGNQVVTLGPFTDSIATGFSIKVYRLYKGEYRLVGEAENNSETVVDNVFDIEANEVFSSDDFTPMSGRYQYVITYVNPQGLESAPSPVSQEFNVVNGGAVNLTSLPIFSATGWTKRLYRVGGTRSAFGLVASMPANQNSFLDNVRDVDIEGSALTSQRNFIPPVMAALVTAYAMLFGAEGAQLRFTNPGEPEYWPQEYFIPFNSNITGLAPVANGLLVFTATQTYLVTGSSPTTLSRQLLSGDQGCVSPRTVQLFKDHAIWVSNDGICMSSGSGIEVISEDKLGKLSIPGNTVSSSVLFDQQYFVSLEGQTIIADFRYGLIFRRLNYSNRLFRSSTTLYAGVTQFVEMFSASTFLPMSYKSPRFIEGRATELKAYKKIYFYSKGDIIIKVLINDELVIEKSVSGERGHVLQIPQMQQRGNFIQFEVSGTGEVYEIEYEVERRQDG